MAGQRSRDVLFFQNCKILAYVSDSKKPYPGSYIDSGAGSRSAVIHYGHNFWTLTAPGSAFLTNNLYSKQEHIVIRITVHYFYIFTFRIMPPKWLKVIFNQTLVRFSHLAS